jgi:hypothetical protein
MTGKPSDDAARGSLRWIRVLVNDHPETFEQALAEHTLLGPITWTSPLRSEGYAEYWDTAFLEAVGQGPLADRLEAFWPKGGPHWDALGVGPKGEVLIVEAKAHIAEFLTPGTEASPKSRAQIEAAFREVQGALRAKPRAPWTEAFYQYANRIAHLHFLRANRVDARLVLIGFLNDREMDGPQSQETWSAAYCAADYCLGLPKRHKLSDFISHVCFDVAALSSLPFD